MAPQTSAAVTERKAQSMGQPRPQPRPPCALTIPDNACVVVHSIHTHHMDGPTPPTPPLCPQDPQRNGPLDRDQATLYYPHQRVLGEAAKPDLVKDLLMRHPNNTHTPGGRAWMPAHPSGSVRTRAIKAAVGFLSTRRLAAAFFCLDLTRPQPQGDPRCPKR